MKHPKYIYNLLANGIHNEVCCDDLKLVETYIRDSIEVLEAFEIPYTLKYSFYDSKKRKYISNVYSRSVDDYLPF